MFNYIKSSLHSTINDYVSASNAFRKIARDTEKRQLEIIFPNTDSDTLDNMIDQGVELTIDSKLDQSLADIEERHSRIKHLEKKCR